MTIEAQDIPSVPVAAEIGARRGGFARLTRLAGGEEGGRFAPGFGRAVVAEIVADRPIYVLAALYAAGVTGLALAVGSLGKLVPFMYVVVWLMAVGSGVILYHLVRKLPAAIRQAPDRPASAFYRLVTQSVQPRAVAGVGLIVTQILVMGFFTSTKNMLTDLSAYVWDRPLADIDALLHGGVDPWRFLEPVVSHPWALGLVEEAYLTGWMGLLISVPVIIAVSVRMTHLRVRFFVTYLLCWMLIGGVLAGLTLSAGPAFFGEVAGDSERFRPLLDYLAVNAGFDTSAFDLQRRLWHFYSTGHVALGSGISAFPSMHLSMATLWVIVGWKTGRAYAVAAIGFLIFTLFASVALAWHYAIDGYAAIVLTLVIWAAVGRWLDASDAQFANR